MIDLKKLKYSCSKFKKIVSFPKRKYTDVSENFTLRLNQIAWHMQKTVHQILKLLDAVIYFKKSTIPLRSFWCENKEAIHLILFNRKSSDYELPA